MTEPTSDASNPEQRKADNDERFQSIGAQLRQRREALKLDQADVARQLHLPGIVINDLETGQVENLSPLYRRGYLGNYARLLDMDPDRLLVEAGEDVLPELQEVLPAAKQGWQLDRYLKIATYAIVTVAIVPPLVYFFIAGGSRMLERDPVAQSTDSPARESITDPSAPSGPAVPDGLEEQPSRPHVSASALPLNPMRPSADRQIESRQESVTPAAALESEESAEPVVSLTALELELLDDSWVEIQDAEGRRLEYDLLRAGQTRQYEGEAPFRLLVGRSSAINLMVDGRLVSWEGDDSGDVVELLVSAQGEIQR